MRLRNILVGLAGFLFALPLLQAAPTGIYWTDNGTKTIQFSQLDGTGITTLVTGLSYPQGIAVTGDHLFWADRDDEAIWRGNADGSNAQVLVNAAPGSPRAVSLTENFIYWAATGALDSISRANIDGSNPTALVTTGLSFPNGIAVTGSYVYWSDSGTLSIERSDLDGGNVVSVVSGLSSTQIPGAVVVTEQYLYWTTRDIALTQGGTPQPGTIQRANIDGSGMTTLVDGLVFPQHVVATATNLYWADQNTGKIQRSNLDGTAVTDIVVGLATPVGLFVVTGTASPADRLQQLLQEVTGVGPGKSLANKVALAQTYYAVPDVQATCAVLTDFVSEVRAQRGKKFAMAEADKFTTDAQAIMTTIGCN